MAKISADRSDHALATRSLREDQALLLRRRLPLVPRAASPHGGNLVAAVRSLFKRSNKASSDAGPELAGRDGIAAMESPQALMCPLEKGVRGMGGLTSRHQTTGWVRVFATANTWRTQRPHGVSGFGTESQ